MEEHKQKSPKSIKFGVITLSDSKYRDFLESKTTDVSGNLIVDTLKKEHKLVFYTVIPDSSELLLSTVADIKEQNVDVIITTGGTGIGVRDITVETYKEIGAGALLSRATAGIYNGTIIISMPGSPNAVQTGLNIISSELGHLVKHVHE